MNERVVSVNWGQAKGTLVRWSVPEWQAMDREVIRRREGPDAPMTAAYTRAVRLRKAIADRLEPGCAISVPGRP